MERQFDIIQPAYGKWVLVWLLGIGLLGLAVAANLMLLTAYDKNTRLLVLLLALVGIMAVANGAAKKASRRPTRVTVAPDKLVIRTFEAGTAQEQQVPFQTIATYRYTAGVRGSETLYLTLRDGRQLTLSANSSMHGPQPFAEIVRAFEAAFRPLQNP